MLFHQGNTLYLKISYINACEKGFNDIVKKGPQIGAPVWGIKVVVNDGVTHSVDSSELAFKTGKNQYLNI
jgi:translation elongation factor EF-G